MVFNWVRFPVQFLKPIIMSETITKTFSVRLRDGKKCKVEQIYLGSQTFDYRITYADGSTKRMSREEYFRLDPAIIN